MSLMRKWPLVGLAGLTVLTGVAAAPVLAADSAPSGGSEIAGYDLNALSAGVRYQLNSPGLLPVGDPNEGNVMEVDMPFARTTVSQGPVISAIGSPLYGGDTLAHLGTAIVTFGAPPEFTVLNYPVLAEADYPPAPGHSQDESFGSPAGSSGGVALGAGTAHATTAPGGATVESHIAHVGVPDPSPVVDIGASTATNKTIIKDSLITSEAVSTTKNINIAGMISIEGVTATATSTSDGAKGKPVAKLEIGKVSVGGQAAYIDNDGIHLASQSPLASGITASAEATLAKALSQDGISLRTISPKTSVKGGSANADAGGLSIILERTVPAVGVPGQSVQLPGQTPIPLGTPDVRLHVELLIGHARAGANATAVPTDVSVGDVGISAPSGDVQGTTQTASDLSASGPGASFGGALNPAPSSLGGASSPTNEAALVASPARSTSQPVPIAWLIAGLLGCIVVIGPLLGYARWQLLEGRLR
jgi:hypothetical protein